MTAALLTIDTELSLAAHGRGVAAEANFATAVLGRVASGEWGIAYQAKMLNARGLKAVFFVEVLFAQVLGIDLLKRVLEPVLSFGHEAQLHIHTEWLQWFSLDLVGMRRGRSMSDFDLNDQCRILEFGIDLLTTAGAPPPMAFRAGNFGANNDTLRALKQVGVGYDTSYNLCAPSGACRITAPANLLDTVSIDGVIEVPVSCFIDYPGHNRPAQLCASSLSELSLVLTQSLARRRRAAVFVSHSFELLNAARTGANWLLVRRFERFCDLLNQTRDLTVTGFLDLDPGTLTDPEVQSAPLRSHVVRTAFRMAEQAVGTLLY